MRRSDQKVHKKYQLPHLADLVKTRRAQADREEELVSQGNFKFCLVKFIELLTDFSAGQPNHLHLRWCRLRVNLEIVYHGRSVFQG